MRTCTGYPPDRCPGQTVTLPVELAAVPATRTFRPGVSPALPFPHATGDGPVSTRPVSVGVGGEGARRFAVSRHRPAIDPPSRGLVRNLGVQQVVDGSAGRAPGDGPAEVHGVQGP